MSTTETVNAAPRPINSRADFLAASPEAALEWFRAIGPERTRTFYKTILMMSTGLPTSVGAVKFHQSSVRTTGGMVANLRRTTAARGKEPLTP